jgi:hypothetical protein
MPTSAALPLRAAAFAGLLALAACNRGGDNNLAEMDNSLIGNGADPALTSALEDQILVDPNLVQQSNPNTVRPPETPVQAQYPAEAGGTRGGQSAVATTGGEAPALSACGAPFNYGNQWAAGSDRGDCHIRVVTFATADPYNRVLEHYRSLAARAGFSAEQQARGGDQVLGGVNGDAAYYLIVTPTGAGSDVALIVNNGR